MTADGTCDAAFAAVREAFEASLATGDDVGAAVAVSVDGRPVVDLWGGPADAGAGRAWQRDTACVTFSCTKALTATAALLLVERGAVALHAPVTDWWPEYGTHGKSDTTAEDLLTHRAGLPAFDRPITVDEAADPAAMAAQLAGQVPEWAPGTAHGYHALTFGWLVGELVRRHAGMPVRDFVHAELGSELHLGVPADALANLARLAAGRPARLPGDLARSEHDGVAALVSAAGNPDSPLMRSTTNPPASFNRPEVLTAGWPAAGLVCTARALADFYARLVAGTVLAPDTLRDAIRERVRGADRTMVLETAFGLGFMRSSATLALPAAAADAFGHPGASGALGLGDVGSGVAFAYIPNLTRPSLGDRRARRLVDAVYESL
jgi:CubicO group peptidase (beta-lactamase class C family)